METFDLKKRRKQLRLTLEQVGDYIGVGKSTVRKWETGMIENMKTDKILLLSEILKIHPLTILGIDENIHSNYFKLYFDSNHIFIPKRFIHLKDNLCVIQNPFHQFSFPKNVYLVINQTKQINENNFVLLKYDQDYKIATLKMLNEHVYLAKFQNHEEVIDFLVGNLTLIGEIIYYTLP